MDALIDQLAEFDAKGADAARANRLHRCIPSSSAFYRVALARAAYGADLGFVAKPYWD